MPELARLEHGSKINALLDLFLRLGCLSCFLAPFKRELLVDLSLMRRSAFLFVLLDEEVKGHFRPFLLLHLGRFSMPDGVHCL